MTIVKFPDHFQWGVATSAYQIEGAVKEDGRGLSIWDTFSHRPGQIINNDNGDIACDSYHRLEEDVGLMKQLGITTYRFSIAWPRILPEGTGQVNPKGIEYYKRLVALLLDNGIEPLCTLYHWDLPQALQDQGGWANRSTIDAFVAYAEIMFKEFEGKIQHWVTINEPWCVSFLSNYLGVHAPGHRDLQLATTVAHHLLVAHGSAVQAFRRLEVPGQIGIAPNVTWIEPYSRNAQDIEACRRETGWWVEWFMDPLFKGKYPSFLQEWFQAKSVDVPMLNGDMETICTPIDFIGINYYTGNIGRYQPNSGLFECEAVDRGDEKTDIDWYIYPEGLHSVLHYIYARYGDIPIYITENGACYNDSPVNGEVQDEKRIQYMKKHLLQLNRCLESGLPIKGYYAWSLLDNFEWAEGYSKRFGLVHVDFDTLQRTPKNSYAWYKQLIADGNLKM